jgi:hypothetical protein
MTFVKFDPEGVQALINNLYAYVEDTDEGRSAIYWASDDRDHPVSTVEEMTSTPALYSCAPADGVSATTMGNAAAILLEVADDLTTRRQEIIDLNSNGITAAAPDGRLTYYLPEGAEDTITNVRSYNTEAATAASADAAALTQARNSTNGTADDGRTTDQILTDMAANQDNPVYGKILVNRYGLGNYLDLAFGYVQADDDDRYAGALSSLSHVLAAATRADNGENGTGLASELATIAGGATHTPGDMVAFNELMSTPGTVYGTKFLVDLGQRFEIQTPSYMASGYGNTDPMYGVLSAMGNNPEAALEYLAPAGDGSVDDAGNWVPSQTATERWELLTSRDWNIQHQDAAEALSAATAAASSFRNRAPSADDPVPADADARATFTTGRAITYFAGEAFSKDDITDAMKQNLAVMAANSPEEIATVAEGGSLKKKDQGPRLANWGVTEADISTLVYRLGDDKDAMATLATGMGEFHHDRIQEAMAGSDAGTISLASEYQQAAASSTYIRSLSQSRFTDEGAEGSAEQKDTVGTGLSVLTTVAAAGVSALSDGAAAPPAFSVGSTIARPLAADAITDALGAPAGGAMDAAASSRTLRARAFADALNHGLLSGDSDKGGRRAVEAAEDHDWYHQDANGNPAIDTASLTNDQAKSMVTWKDQDVKNEDDLKVLGELEHSITDGVDHGDDYRDDKEARPRTD